jgi:hypothetical protein
MSWRGRSGPPAGFLLKPGLAADCPRSVILAPVMPARLGPKRAGRVSPLRSGTSDLNFPGNLLRRDLAQFRSDGKSGFPLADHGATNRHAMLVTSSNFRRTNRRTCQVPGALLHLKLGRDRPDVLGSSSRSASTYVIGFDAVHCACSSRLSSAGGHVRSGFGTFRTLLSALSASGGRNLTLKRHRSG